MRQHQRQLQISVSLLGTFTVSLMMLALIACEASQKASSTVSVGQTPIDENLSKDNATKQAYFDLIKRNQAARATIAAQLTLPPRTPGPPPTEPLLPTPTLIMGMIQDCVTAGSYYVFDNCWRGVINGRVIMVGAGTARRSDGTPSGVIVVSNNPAQVFFGTGASLGDAYDVPTALDEGRIVSVNGNIVTLTQAYSWTTPSLFYFDLASRQWVSVSGTPLPTFTAEATPFHK